MVFSTLWYFKKLWKLYFQKTQYYNNAYPKKTKKKTGLYHDKFLLAQVNQMHKSKHQACACFTYMLRCVCEPVQQHVLSSRLSDRRLLSLTVDQLSLLLSTVTFSSIDLPKNKHNTLTVCRGHQPRPCSEKSSHRLAEMSCAKITKRTGSQPNY